MPEGALPYVMVAHILSAASSSHPLEVSMHAEASLDGCMACSENMLTPKCGTNLGPIQWCSGRVAQLLAVPKALCSRAIG